MKGVNTAARLTPRRIRNSPAAQHSRLVTPMIPVVTYAAADGLNAMAAKFRKNT